MKRAIFVLVVLFGSFALFAQVHGPAASVNSFTGRSMSVGPAASVLSVGPRGWATGPCNATGCINPYFTPSINFQTGTVQFGQHFNGHSGRNGHHGRGRSNASGGYVYSYAYPYPVYASPDEGDDQQQVQAAAQDQSQDPPAPTIYERRPLVRPAPNPEETDDSRYGEHYLDQREQRPAVSTLTPGNHNMSPVSDEQIPVLIVYKDGHEQEIQNYAIVGDTLYDLGTSFAHKIKLADLDLKQTIQKNEKRGVDFSVPASYKPVG